MWCFFCLFFLGNRRIKFEEFHSIFLTEKQKAKPVTAEQFIETLSAFDKDQAEKVASGELRHVLTALGNLVVVGKGGWGLATRRDCFHLRRPGEVSRGDPKYTRQTSENGWTRTAERAPGNSVYTDHFQTASQILAPD